MLKWGLQSLEMEDFLRERERGPREGGEQRRRREKRKTRKSLSK